MNNIDNHFEKNPIVKNEGSSRWRMPQSIKGSLRSGDLVPFYNVEVLPGDTFEIDFKGMFKFLSPAVPVMDNAFIDIRFFFVPFRLCTNDEKEFKALYGENISGYWYNSTEATLENTGNSMQLSDIVEDEDTGWMIYPQSAYNYFGLPLLKSSDTYYNAKINLLLPHAYGLIWNEWYRDENFEAPLDLTHIASYDYADDIYNNYLNQHCLKVSKRFDRFTACLPSPQKGPSVLIPLTTDDLAPVITSLASTDSNKGGSALAWRSTTTNNLVSSAGDIGVSTNGNTVVNTSSTGATTSVRPGNLWADLSVVLGLSVNEMRYSVALQRLFEKDARNGSRFREQIFGHWGVQVPDSTVQVPEFLGGQSIPVVIDTMFQTSSTNESSYLGQYGAFSLTNFGSNQKIFKSFTEPGIVIGCACVRVENSYSQGIPKLFLRNRRYDFYDPVFAHIGEQPVYLEELYAVGNGAESKSTVFGYNEAWSEYRYMPNKLVGYLSANSGDNLLSKWTFSTNFTSRPYLNANFIRENRSNLSQTKVASSSYDFVFDMYVDLDCTREMPVYSIPGLVDHF